MTEFDNQGEKTTEEQNEIAAYQIANGGVNVNPLVNQEGQINLVSAVYGIPYILSMLVRQK